ncbi:MAG: XRE family transcriptional regulator [Muribaculaceae bacterium]|nr:XRE family transcriptional regulator [Muribaculaceae bacterium]
MEPIGTMIREELERQERSVTWFARKLSCDRSNVYRLFQKHSVDTALLGRISVILGRDFFAELSENLPVAIRRVSQSDTCVSK